MSRSAPGPGFLSDSIKNAALWQDREIRFDASARDLSLRNGEQVIEVFNSVEDTKGNAGDMGYMTLSNLRFMWQSKQKPRINLSVGLACITSITSRLLQNKLRGRYESVNVMSKSGGTRYEFIFTPYNEAGTSPINNQQLLNLMGAVCKAYTATRLFRDLKLRSAIMSPQGRSLKTLPSEKIYNKFNGVWNLSSDQGNLGTMIVTNIRIVWYANMNELFNLSLPYIQINGIRIRESKFGTALVIESSESSGGYVLGFRIDPIDRLKSVHSELLNLYNIHASNPCLGVDSALGLEDYVPSAAAVSAQAQQFRGLQDESEFVEESNEGNRPDTLAMYMALEADSNVKKDNEVVYNSELGLAIEKLRPGFTLQSLWSVLPDE